jgi:hypothetical protein
MNPRINKMTAEIDKVTAKIAELQAKLPVLEAAREQLENDEVLRMFRSADIKPGEFYDFLREYQALLGIVPATKPVHEYRQTEANLETTEDTYAKAQAQ